MKYLPVGLISMLLLLQGCNSSQSGVEDGVETLSSGDGVSLLSSELSAQALSEANLLSTEQVTRLLARPSALQPMESESALLEYLKEGLINHRSSTLECVIYDCSVFDDIAYDDTGDVADTVTEASPTTGDTAGNATARSSTTTLQLVDVDESDLVKNNNDYLFFPTARYGEGEKQIAIHRMYPDATTEAITAVSLTHVVEGLYLAQSEEEEPRELLVATTEGGGSWWSSWFDFAYWMGRSAAAIEVTTLDITTPAEPQLRDHLLLQGNWIDSRRIGDRLYLVSRFAPTVSLPDPLPQDFTEEDYIDLVEAATAEQLLPTITVNGSEAEPLVRAEQCYQVSNSAESVDTHGADLVVITGISLTDPSRRNSLCLTGTTETLFMTSSALYLASSRYHYEQSGDELSYDGGYLTDLHKFSLLDGLQYRGSGEVEGHLGWESDKKSFRMGEVDGHLAIFTTLGDGWRWDSSPATRLTILEEGAEGGLDVVSTLPNESRPDPLGKPNERLYASRFLGDKAYLVTFQETDPLYVIDLGDTDDPRATGELEMTGYSDYLYPVGEDHLLGIGREATEWGTLLGVKVALFDVSDIDNPAISTVLSFGEGPWSATSAALSDHHALTWLRQVEEGVDYLALPICTDDEEKLSLVEIAPEAEFPLLLRHEIQSTNDMAYTYCYGLQRSVIQQGEQGEVAVHYLFEGEESLQLHSDAWPETTAIARGERYGLSKMSSTGALLDDTATEWSCVKDHQSGLIWEVKNDDGGIHDKDNTYRWGGVAERTAEDSLGGDIFGDWDELVNGSNSEQLCGFSDWRVPTKEELGRLVTSVDQEPTIDSDYFPMTESGWYWSSSVASSFHAWSSNFGDGFDFFYTRSNNHHVRLVRGGERF